MVEKLTITRLGEIQNKSGVSQKTGKPYNFNVIGFTAEGREGWINFNYNGTEDAHGLEIGKEYEFVLTSREYNGKTYWDAKFVKPADKTDIKIEQILNQLVAIKIELAIIKDAVQPRKKSYPTAESEGIDPEKAFPDYEPSTEELNEIFPD